MKTIILCLVFLALVTGPVQADNLFLESGPGFFKSTASELFVLRYTKDTSKLFGLSSYYEALLAYWNGHDRDEAIGVARAVSFGIGKEQYFSFALGLMAISHTTDHLGTPLQIYFRYSYDLKIKRRDISFAIVHISNGKMVFGWDGPNSGENFITLSIGLF